MNNRIVFKHDVNLQTCLLFFLFLLGMMSCKENKPLPPKENPYANAEIEIRVFNNDTTSDSILGGYGYDIYLFKGLYVHQPHIPAINGNRGFNSASDAEKTAGLTAYKIRNNIMPPSLTVSELDSIGVLK